MGNPSTPASDSGLPTVVLDPGHGGSDQGAGRIGSVAEKDLVLAIALDTATVLRTFNVQVVLTRTDDRALSVAERLAIAQTANARALISLHLNATRPPTPDVNGLETYYYSGTPPRTTSGTTSNTDSASTDSAALAQLVHPTLIQTLQLTDRGIKTATFPILRSPTVPAIHLELGFLTGNQDALNLTNPDYRTKLSRAIAVGILQFVQKPVG